MFIWRAISARAQRTMGVATSACLSACHCVMCIIRSHIAGRNMAVWLAFVFSFVYCVVSQAPGDGDSLCTDEFINGMANPFYDSRPTYADNVRPLMDSRNYVVLLDEGAHIPWQQVDNDNNNTDTVVTEWSQLGKQLCSGTVTVCGFDQGTQENWLITQHISRELAGGQRLRKVTAQFNITFNGCDISRQCRQTFDVYKWQTSTTNKNAARNTNNYEKVNRVSPQVSDGFGSSVESLDIDLDAESGFYLAVVDLSTCITINRILVFYYVCPAETSQLITRPEVIQAISLDDSAVTTDGECVENSSTQSGLNPLLSCGNEGRWNVIIPCHCNPRYELVDGQHQCSECPVGTYSEGVSNSPCEPCPANSQSTQTGMTECPCDLEYYRAPDEGPSVNCTRSPSAPLNLSISNVTNTSAILSWLPPEDGGGRNFSEIYYTITARGTGGASTVVFTVNDSGIVVMGLTPGADYTFSVTAENAVSSQDMNITDRTVTISATTEEGVAGMVSSISPPEEGSTVVSWSPPCPPNGVILYYNVRITRVDNGELLVFIKELNDTKIDINNYDYIPGVEYNVMVQAVTSVGPGNFSEPMTVVVTPSSDSSSNPTVIAVVVVVIVVIILVLCCVAAGLVAYIFWFRSHVKHKTFFGIELPTRGRRMYVDPRTYEHVEEAVQDFAMEIPPKSIRLTEEIGNGEFGNVYCGIWKTDTKEQLPIALKTLKPGSSQKLRDDFLTEASIMGQFDHPNVIKLYGVVTVVEPVMIVMEYMEKGSLYYYLRKHDEQFNSTQLVNMALGVARGMEYLSEVGFVHRDLAARNVLVDRDETTKVADFGLSRETVEDVYEVTKGGKIPVRWTAPEAIAYRKFTTSSDVWSFGVLLWEVMSYCQQPYDDWDNQTVLTKLDAGHRLQKPKDCPETVYKCMLECWNADRNKRPSFGQVVKILEILLDGNLTDGPKPKPRSNQRASEREVASPLEHETVETWLQSIKMDKYMDKFEEAGCTSIQSCLSLNADELNRMGIILAGHQNKIITSIRKGREHFDRQNSIRI